MQETTTIVGWRRLPEDPMVVVLRFLISLIHQLVMMDQTGQKGRLFTETTRGTGKFKGWAENGIKLYNRIDATIEKQRDDPALRSDFDVKLKTWYLTEGGGEGNVGLLVPTEEEEGLVRKRKC